MSSLRDKIKREQEEQRKLREEGRRRLNEKDADRYRALGETDEDPLIVAVDAGETREGAVAEAKARRKKTFNSLADRISSPAEVPAEEEEFRPTPTGRRTPETDALTENSLSTRVKDVVNAKAQNETPSKTDSTPPPPSLADTLKLEAQSDEKDPWAKLSEDLESARGEYKGEKEKLDFREAIEKIANGLGKVGAGLYGNKVGTDMSGVKFDQSDWDRKRDHAQKDFQTNLSEVSERRKEQLSKENNKTENDYRNSVLKETKRHNKEMEKLSGAKITAAGAAALKKADDAALEKHRKAVEATSAELYDIAKNLDSDTISEDVAAERIQSILVNNLKMDPDTAREVVVDDGFFFDGINDISEIQSRVNALSVQQMGRASIRENSNLADGEVAMVGPDGDTYRVPEDKADAYAKQGYKRI